MTIIDDSHNRPTENNIYDDVKHGLFTVIRSILVVHPKFSLVIGQKEKLVSDLL
jgi:hypothetical protein